MLKFKANRAMRGWVQLGSSSNNFPSVSLYNNSTGADILGVWQFESLATSGEGFVSYQQGIIGTAAGAVSPVVPDGIQQAGALYALDGTVQYTNYIGLAANFMLQNGFAVSHWPTYFLPPKWSLNLQSTSTGTTQASFLWQPFHAADLEDRPCRICEPELFIVAHGS